MLSEAKIISIFCIVHDMLKACGQKEDIRIRVRERDNDNSYNICSIFCMLLN